MSDDLSTLKSLIQGMQFKDTRLKQALDLLVDKISGIYLELHPLTLRRLEDVATSKLPPADISFALCLANKTSVKIVWNEVANASNYELREGLSWDSAARLVVTPQDSCTLLPLTSGKHNYLVKAIGTNGLLSVNAYAFSITVTSPAPVIISPTIIDNNVLLRWTIPSSVFDIDYYIVKRNGAENCRIKGTFATILEQVSGTFTYSVIAVDLAGNQSAETSISCEVRQPPDYQLQDTFNSAFAGTKVNCKVENGKLLLCVNTTETWAEHFSNNGFASIQAQVSAGYPLYLQPTPLSGSYEEVIDYGSLFSSSIITASLTKESISGDIDVVVKFATSSDGLTYSTWSTSNPLFATDFRYVKVRLEFTSAAATNVIYITSLNVRLDVKQEVDSGYIAADKDDVNGTEVTFNKSFKDVNSITTTAESLFPITVIVDFVDIPNPTSFTVYCFDSSGNRVDATVSWKARGIV